MHTRTTPKYIVLDGLDGSGKGSVINALQRDFLPYGRGGNLVYTCEPGGTPFGETLRNLILKTQMDPYSEMCLFLANRKEVRLMVGEHLLEGRHVISDRSDSSTFAFQIRGRGRPQLEDLFWAMNKAITPAPALYIFLDLSPEVARERAGKRADAGGDSTRFDQEELAFHYRVRQGFVDFAKKCGTKCTFVDASQSKEIVVENVFALVRECLSEA